MDEKQKDLIARLDSLKKYQEEQENLLKVSKNSVVRKNK